jgi:hypothetical protein
LTKVNKTFDCVDMKHEAQQKLHAECESRKHEFPSYFAFLEARSRESRWQQEFWAKVANVQRESGT